MKGEVIEHEYFGSERVINDLKQFDTYHFGYVYLKKYMFIKSKGKVTHIIDYQIPNFKTNIIDFLLHSNL